jgi:hypothetical protein
MTARVQLIAVIGALALFFLVFELVRRRRMLERYALLWLLCSAVLAALALWTDLLGDFSSLVGIKTPSNALFLVAFGFVLLLLLHFSLVISTLSEKTVVLAQHVGLLESQLAALRREQTESGVAGHRSVRSVRVGRHASDADHDSL